MAPVRPLGEGTQDAVKLFEGNGWPRSVAHEPWTMARTYAGRAA